MAGAKGFTLAEIAGWSDGRVEGDAETEVTGIAPLRDARTDQLGLLADPRYLKDVEGSRAGAFLVAAKLVDQVADDTRPRVIVDDPHAAMLPMLEALDPTPTHAPGVHPTAVLEAGVELGPGVSVGAYAVLEAGAVIGEGSRVGAHCVIGQGAVLGARCRLNPHVVLYPGTVLGDEVVVHSGASLGVDGFGYVFRDGRYLKVPQVGRVVVGDGVEIGANTVIDRGSIGDTVVGEGTKIDNLVQIGHNARIGAHVGMAAQCGLAGSTTVGDFVQMGGQAGSSGHLTIGKGARLGPRGVPISDVEPGATVMGFPARDQKEHMRIHAAQARLPDLIRKVRSLEREVERLTEGREGAWEPEAEEDGG